MGEASRTTTPKEGQCLTKRSSVTECLLLIACWAKANQVHVQDHIRGSQGAVRCELREEVRVLVGRRCLEGDPKKWNVKMGGFLGNESFRRGPLRYRGFRLILWLLGYLWFSVTAAGGVPSLMGHSTGIGNTLAAILPCSSIPSSSSEKTMTPAAFPDSRGPTRAC